MKHIAPIIMLLFCTAARANPIAMALHATDRIYMASEHLTANVSAEVAELRGTFKFKYRQDVPAPGQKSFVMLEIPIWFPESHPTDSSVAAFWKAFPRDQVTEITPRTRAAFDKAVGLRAFLGGEPLRVEQFATLTHTNTKQRWAAREWQQEAGFCCLAFRFYFTKDSTLTEKPLVLQYRQPLLQSNGIATFFYLPDFQNLPKGVSTADTNHYAITITAQPNYSLIVTNGDKTSRIESGQSVTLNPKHHQAIRAVAAAQPNKGGTIKRSH